jgi:hypothetical protein
MLTSPRKGQSQRDHHYHYQRQRGRDCHRHYHMHAKIVKAEQAGETNRDDAGEQNRPPDDVRDEAFKGRKRLARAPSSHSRP